jgi:trehalose synthase
MTNNGHPRIANIEDYEQFIGPQPVARIIEKARKLCDLRVAKVNSTANGGGVAELLSSMIPLMNKLGLTTEWRVINGGADFFGITKNIHNGLQGNEIHFTAKDKRIYEEVVYENSVQNHLDHDFVIVHDPQPLPIIRYKKKICPWIWRCHLDLSSPNTELWNYLIPDIKRYDAVIFSIKEYTQQLLMPQFFFMPAIDPFTLKNRELSEEEMNDCLARYNIPTDLPLVVQVSRFDRFKDPEGAIKAVKLARAKKDCTLVLLGNFAADDPEGKEVFEDLLENQDESIFIMPSGDDNTLVNTLQRRAHVVLQKSIREGFGLTVTEAMWKGRPVIGGKVGGIVSQIQDGVNGFLVSSAEEAAERIVQLLSDEDLRVRLGQKARETVRERFLLPRLLEQYLDLLNYLEKQNHIKEIISKETCPLNVVFDLGGVLLTWEPEEIIKAVFEESEIHQTVMDEIFFHPDWIELDRGTMDGDIAIERAAVRTGISVSQIKKLMKQVPHSLTPVSETIDLIHTIKRNGNRVFVLSNIQTDSIEFVEQTYSFWDLFDGVVVSCRIQMVKPEIEIYQHLLQLYSLMADQTIFIDDTPSNLDAASKVGMKVIKFENPSQCEQELKALGCI